MTTTTATKSHTASIFPLLLALVALEEKSVTPFKPMTKVHKRLLEFMEESKKAKYDKEQIKTFVSSNISELNAILEKNGFSIRLEENPSDSNDVGVVCILELDGPWVDVGGPTKITYDGKKYSAIKLTEGTSVATSLGKNILVIETLEYIRTKREDSLKKKKPDEVTNEDVEKMIETMKQTPQLFAFIEIADKERSGFELFKHVYDLAMNMDFSSEKHPNAIIPYVDLDEIPDMSWATGLSAGLTCSISQIVQQNILKITHYGIRARSASGGLQSLGFTNQLVTIDEPFNLWLGYMPSRNRGKVFPLFAAYVAPDSWKKPQEEAPRKGDKTFW